MNFEQILIRLGVDASAVTSGLGRVGSTVKAWGVSILYSFNSMIGKMFAGVAILQGLNSVKEKILEIARVSRETGAGTDFVQGLGQELEKVGLGLNMASSGLFRFNKLLGDAKSGSIRAIEQLKEMGVINDKSSLQTLNFSGAVHNLAVSFDKLNDKQKQAFLLTEAFGRSGKAMQAVFEKGAAAVDSMSKPNFFTKISTSSIADLTDFWKQVKNVGVVTSATLVNVFDSIARGFQAMVLGPKRAAEFNYLTEKSLIEQRQNEVEEDSIKFQEEKNQLLDTENSLKERSLELSSQIEDRDKESVRDMADRARHLLGIRSPLQMSHTVTSRMRTALRIDNLEERAKLAWERGDDSKSSRLQSEADQIRASSPWMKFTDKNPMLKTENELSRVNNQLEPISRAVKLITDAN